MFVPPAQVDFLSFKFEELDLFKSWQYATKHKSMANGRRLENASWRKFFQLHFQLPKSNPLIIEWLKDSDVCWLYGYVVLCCVVMHRPYHAFEPLGILDLEAKYANEPSIGSSTSKSITTSPRSRDLKSALKRPTNEAVEFTQVLEHVYREYKQQDGRISPADLLLSLRASPSFKRSKQPNKHSDAYGGGDKDEDHSNPLHVRECHSLPEIFKSGNRVDSDSVIALNPMSRPGSRNVSVTGSTGLQRKPSKKNLRFDLHLENSMSSTTTTSSADTATPSTGRLPASSAKKSGKPKYTELCAMNDDPPNLLHPTDDDSSSATEVPSHVRLSSQDGDCRAKMTLSHDDDDDDDGSSLAGYSDSEDDICIKVVPKRMTSRAEPNVPTPSFTPPAPSTAAMTTPRSYYFETGPFDFDEGPASVTSSPASREHLDLPRREVADNITTPKNMSPQELDAFFKGIYQAESTGGSSGFARRHSAGNAASSSRAAPPPALSMHELDRSGPLTPSKEDLAEEDIVSSARILQEYETIAYQKYESVRNRTQEVLANAWDLGRWIAQVPTRATRSVFGGWI